MYDYKSLPLTPAPATTISRQQSLTSRTGDIIIWARATQKKEVYFRLARCWANVVDGGPT